jgi:hypothetical protein
MILQDAINNAINNAKTVLSEVEHAAHVLVDGTMRMVTIMADPTGDYAVSLGELVK